jgi:hypothetical protein
MLKKIRWHGFLKKCVEEYPKEVVAILYTDFPFTENEEWYAFPVKNIHPEPLNNWLPCKKDMQEIKKIARGLGLTKIGNIHTHPYPQGVEFKEEVLQELLLPSDTDCKFAKGYGDLVRGIIVCDSKEIYDIRFHHPDGVGVGKIDIWLEQLDEVTSAIPPNTIL